MIFLEELKMVIFDIYLSLRKPFLVNDEKNVVSRIYDDFYNMINEKLL